jgi:hypothetical protein
MHLILILSQALFNFYPLFMEWIRKSILAFERIWRSCNTYCHNSFLGYSPDSLFLFQKIKKYIRTKNKKIQKIITMRRGCQSAQKMTRSWLRRLKNSNIKIWQYIFYIWSPVDKEKFNLSKKVQNQMFMDSIKFYWRFNWIYIGFDYKKNWFLSQFRL